MKLWVDDLRPAPQGYFWVKTTDLAVALLNEDFSNDTFKIEELNLDHDAGDMFKWGGDYIEILNYMEMCRYKYGMDFDFIIKFHSANPVGVQNMKRICEVNGWKYK